MGKLEIVRFTVGPLETNAYLVADAATGRAVLVDPGGEGKRLVREARSRGWTLEAIWVTHAHFDHFAGLHEVQQALKAPVPVALHPDDLPLWQMRGGADWFGLDIPQPPAPDLLLTHGQQLHVGDLRFEVRHAPGHSPGHVMFYNQEHGILLCGDVIFYMGIGRTDLPFGDFETLVRSIRTQVYTLPEETRLLPGHGPETTVGGEKMFNPFV